MPPFILLKLIGKAVLYYSGLNGGVIANLVVDALPEIAKSVWDGWSQETDPKQRRQQVENIAQASHEDIQREIDKFIKENAATSSEKVRQFLAVYLRQVQPAIRQTLRRPTDPTGRTIPLGLELRKAGDLVPFLPTRLPRFKQGDRPLAGVAWELEELLGVGGFGEVWKAHNAHFDGIPPVALKFCLDPTARERLLQHEAEVLNQIMRHGRHPGIIALQQTYLDADPACLQYEYVDGGDLTGLILEWHRQVQKPSPVEIARVIMRISEIIGFAHRLDPPIVHRDLKPANILIQSLDGERVFKIADFGIGGIATSEAIKATNRGTSVGAFMTGAVRGSYTPAYASPEQIRGNPPNPQDDVYALGVIWYQMMTGDLSKGCPSGLAWRRRFDDQGVKPSMVELLESCFNDQDDRPANAAILAEKIGALPDFDDQDDRPANTAPDFDDQDDRPANAVILAGQTQCAKLNIICNGEWMLFDIKPKIYWDGQLVDRGSLKYGFNIPWQTVVGPHLVEWMLPLGGIFRFPVQLPKGGSYEVRFAFSRWRPGGWSCHVTYVP